MNLPAHQELWDGVLAFVEFPFPNMHTRDSPHSSEIVSRVTRQRCFDSLYVLGKDSEGLSMGLQDLSVSAEIECYPHSLSHRTVRGVTH